MAQGRTIELNWWVESFRFTKPKVRRGWVYSLVKLTICTDHPKVKSFKLSYLLGDKIELEAKDGRKE